MWRYRPSDQTNQKNNLLVDQFLFIHIPKTGGTSFRFVLNNHFDATDIYPSQDDLKHNGGSYLSQKEFIKQEQYIGKSVISGHFNINVIKHIKNDSVKTMAFFRNPLDRIISTIKHIQSYNDLYKGADVNLILEENLYQIMHGQCRAMGFYIKKRNMNEVRQNIIGLDFIGITEYFEESLKLCNSTFGWELMNIPPKNVLNQEIYSLLNVHSKMKISKELGPELQTYNIAVNHFKLRCKEHGIEIGAK